ncbi:MAG: molybdate ABC transporter permease subunit [Anaerolineae bacterium]|nr:molybdate ABC transporter permease subunit [Anaerolineae bacterium]
MQTSQHDERPRPWSRLIQAAWMIPGGVMAVILILPIAALVIRAVQARAWEQAPDAGIVEAMVLSFGTTAISAGLTFMLGTPLAYGLARQRMPFKQVIGVLVELPLVLPPAVAGLALLVTFGRRGLLGPTLETAGIALPFTTAAVIVAQVFVAAPLYIRAAQVGFQGIDPEIEDAARVDGASAFKLFWRVALPLAGRAIGAGLALSWARALGEFGATILFAGSLQGRTQTMPLLVYNVFERDINAAIWTGLLLVGLALAALLVSRKLAGERGA